MTNNMSAGFDVKHNMAKWHRGASAMILVGLVGALGACTKGDVIGGNTKSMTATEVSDGFLPEPQLLSENKGTFWSQTWMQPGINMATYADVMIDPVTIIVSPQSKLANLPDAQRYDLANTFYSDMYNAVSASCKVTNVPGPQTVRLNIALSDATSSNAVVKTVATYTPYVGLAYKAANVAFNNGVGYFSGTASAEGYATNGATGELIWQGIDKRGGNSPVLQNTTDSWLDVHNAFKDWSGQLVSKLQQLGICHKTLVSK